MNTRTRLLAAALAATCFPLLAPTAHAQSMLGPDDSRILGLGVQVGPQYDGSDDMAVRPGLTGRFPVFGVDVEIRGTGLRADLLDGPMAAGPTLSYRFGRDGGDIDNAQVAALPNVEDSLELGAYASLPLGQAFALSLEASKDVSAGHGGATARAALDWRQELRPATTAFASLGVSAMDGAFADAFYGVDAAGSAASGLAAYNPDGGLRDASLTVGLTQELSERLSLSGALTYRELLGDAGDSPITATGGTGQLSLTAGLGVRF